jgi:hypothetical protein
MSRFTKNDLELIQLTISKKGFNLVGVDVYSRLEFRRGESRLSHRIEAQSVDEVLSKTISYIKALDNIEGP